MRWQVWRKTGPCELPKTVQNALESQFRLDSEAMGRLRLLEKSGKYAGRPVRFIRIIDSSLVNMDAKTSLKYSFLDDGNHKNAVQFEGHIEKEGHVLLHDLRPRQA